MRYLAGFISAFYNPLKNPDAPTIGTATGGDSSASVAFTAPANIGGSAITSYVVTVRRTSDGTLTTGSGSSSPVVVTGLTNGVAYTATVIAVNSYGPSVSSAASNSVTPLPAIGAVYGGGYFAGQISTAGNGVADFNLVVAPKSTGEQNNIEWKLVNTGGDPTSVINGPANSAAMNSGTYPAAQFCEGLSIGGFSDWYMPALNELEVCYYNLKPTTTSNNTSTGINANAVPARASNYTAGNPAQTSAAIFRTGQSQAYSTFNYWASTQFSSTKGWEKGFDTGYVYGRDKDNTFNKNVRAVRRVAV
jgi:hypothetical protein